MDLRRLNHLVCLADTGNFRQAATLSHITQSAFSRSIQAAEEEFGLQLFDRGTTRVTCTDAGAFVVERARKLLFDRHCLERDVELYRERAIGDLAFGSGPFPAVAIIPALMTELRTRFPAVHVRIDVNNADSLAARLRAEELDFYLADIRNIAAADDLMITKVAKLGAGLYVRTGHPLLAEPSVHAPMLLPYGIGTVRLPETIRLMLGKSMGLAEGQSLLSIVESDDLNLLKHIAATTDTVIGCPNSAAMQEVATGTLVQLEVVKMPVQYADIAIVSLKGRSFSLMADFAVERIIQISSEYQSAEAL